MAEAETRHAVQCSSSHFPLADISAIMEEAKTRHTVQLTFLSLQIQRAPQLGTWVVHPMRSRVMGLGLACSVGFQCC